MISTSFSCCSNTIIQYLFVIAACFQQFGSILWFYHPQILWRQHTNHTNDSLTVATRGKTCEMWNCIHKNLFLKCFFCQIHTAKLLNKKKLNFKIGNINLLTVVCDSCNWEISGFVRIKNIQRIRGMNVWTRVPLLGLQK